MGMGSGIGLGMGARSSPGSMGILEFPLFMYPRNGNGSSNGIRNRNGIQELSRNHGSPGILTVLASQGSGMGSGVGLGSGLGSRSSPGSLGRGGGSRPWDGSDFWDVGKGKWWENAASSWWECGNVGNGVCGNMWEYLGMCAPSMAPSQSLSQNSQSLFLRLYPGMFGVSMAPFPKIQKILGSPPRPGDNFGVSSPKSRWDHPCDEFPLSTTPKKFPPDSQNPIGMIPAHPCDEFPVSAPKIPPNPPLNPLGIIPTLPGDSSNEFPVSASPNAPKIPKSHQDDPSPSWGSAFPNSPKFPPPKFPKSLP
ncbi:uncharacterized protein LOC116994377 [Catharus ustulatus]|uniref:uncharacterized protein LOC116994377 n=1 Tax=Catharus ustulatus TaxID=91951 RepID=UPI00140AA64E|nr:uncharacterized protein LOC116994377 [Catharus ustulatus]